MDYGACKRYPEGAGEECKVATEVKRKQVLPLDPIRQSIGLMQRNGGIRIRELNGRWECTEDVSKGFITPILQVCLL